MHLGAKTRRRLHTVTNHMDALLTEGLWLFFGLFFSSKVSLVHQKETKQADLIQSNPGTIAHVTYRCLHSDEVSFGNALIREIKHGLRDCDGLMSRKSKASSTKQSILDFFFLLSEFNTDVTTVQIDRLDHPRMINYCLSRRKSLWLVH